MTHPRSAFENTPLNALLRESGIHHHTREIVALLSR